MCNNNNNNICVALPMGGDTNGNNKGEEDTHKTTDEKISVEEGGMMKKRYNPYANRSGLVSTRWNPEYTQQTDPRVECSRAILCISVPMMIIWIYLGYLDKRFIDND